jgi:pimeloyl-ACP methyl ester carboxylesterase
MQRLQEFVRIKFCGPEAVHRRKLQLWLGFKFYIFSIILGAKLTVMIISKKFAINGVHQQLYLNLCSNSKATLLFLHGGPGWADAPWAGITCQALWGFFNTVHWDQRGANRSSINSLETPTTLTVDQMVKDGIEICAVLKKEFKIERPILVGHSWGALLGVLMASRAPALFHSYIGIGQLVYNQQSEPLSLKFCKERARELGKSELVSELSTMPEDFYRAIPTLFRQREIVSELGGEFITPVDQKQLEEWMLQSPLEYQTNWNTLYEGCESTCKSLWPEMIDINLFEIVKSLDLPVKVLQGRQDYCTPSEPVVRWLNGVRCTGTKELIWFENSAHWPQIEENEKFSRIIFESV